MNDPISTPDAADSRSVEVVNTAILNTAISVPRAETGEILSDRPSAVVAGVEQSAAISGRYVVQGNGYPASGEFWKKAA